MDSKELIIRRVKEHTDVSGLRDLIPNRLYKYRHWNGEVKYKFHKNILTERQLYFSNSASFEDPHDCRFPVKFDFTFESIKERMRESYYKLPGFHALSNIQLESLIENQYKDRYSTESKRKDREEEFFELFNDSLSIYCLSMSNDSEKMWNKYGDHFSGFCVGFNFHEDLQSLLTAYVGGTYVKYVDKTSEHLTYPDINSESGLEDYIWFSNDLIKKKYKSWLFEKEYRLYKWNFDHLNKVDIPKFDDIFTVPNDCFCEIIFGYKMKENYIQEIKEVCKNNNLLVNFRMADLHNGSVVIRDIGSA